MNKHMPLLMGRVKEAKDTIRTVPTNQSDLSGRMDLEALLANQQKRVQLLEQQLNQQIQAVEKKNNQIGKLNGCLNEINKVLCSSCNGRYISSLSGTCRAVRRCREDGVYGRQTVKKIEMQIDSSSNALQMDMLRLQSISNKRNGAFDTMTNFYKKTQDSRNSIIQNMK